MNTTAKTAEVMLSSKQAMALAFSVKELNGLYREVYAGTGYDKRLAQIVALDKVHQQIIEAIAEQQPTFGIIETFSIDDLFEMAKSLDLYKDGRLTSKGYINLKNYLLSVRYRAWRELRTAS